MGTPRHAADAYRLQLGHQPPSEQVIQREYYLFDWSALKVVSFETIRDIRICNDYRRHDIQLTVKCDDKAAAIGSKACHSCRAQRLQLSSSDPLGDDQSLSGTIEHQPVRQVTPGQSAAGRESLTVPPHELVGQQPISTEPIHERDRGDAKSSAPEHTPVSQPMY